MTDRAHPGLFISFEGTEGCGKSTQLRLLMERLQAQGFSVTQNQEPGATDIGAQIRRVLLHPANDRMAGMTELLLMFASRTQAAAEIIRPALQAGSVVLSDRFTDSTLAYQGEARGLGFETVLAIHKLVLGDLVPDLTICIDVDLESGLARARRRNSRSGAALIEDRIDQQAIGFHQLVVAGYRRIAALDPARFRIVDGRGSFAEVAERVWREAEPVLLTRVQK